MGSKPYYRNVRTGNYGVIEGQTFSSIGGNSNERLSLRLLEVIDGMIELSFSEESASPNDLVKVSPDEVQKALLGI